MSELKWAVQYGLRRSPDGNMCLLIPIPFITAHKPSNFITIARKFGLMFKGSYPSTASLLIILCRNLAKQNPGYSPRYSVGFGACVLPLKVLQAGYKGENTFTKVCFYQSYTNDELKKLCFVDISILFGEC